MMTWVYDPHRGGVKITPEKREQICKQVDSYARTRPWYPKIQLKVRFKGQLCYIDTVASGDERQLPLCRLRYFNLEELSLAFFTFSNDTYQACNFRGGKQTGTITSALELCEPFII